MQNKYDAVIFDWAGTTVDYGCFAPVQAFVKAFKHFDIEPTLKEVREPMGLLKIEHIRTMLGMSRLSEMWKERHGRAWTEEDVNAIYDQFESKLMESLAEYTDIKPGVLEAVDKLRRMGLKIGSTTGYTEQMMAVVTKEAGRKGYVPDYWISPDLVGGMGRPYPYMIFENMKALGLSDVRRVIKAGDTVSDIKEGRNAGVTAVGIVEGSSEMGLSQEEYADLSQAERKAQIARVTDSFKQAGADYVVLNMAELVELICN